MEGKKEEKKRSKKEAKDIKEEEALTETTPYSCIPRLEKEYKDLSYD